MKNRLLLISLGFLLLVGACKKEVPKVTYPYSCVADSFDCRKGKWANISKFVTIPDTLDFHTSSKYSNYYPDWITGERRGIIWQEYKFVGSSLVIQVDMNNNPTRNPMYTITTYNDTTGIWSFHNMGSTKDLVYEYKRIP
tara:strand:- start:41 stop:460 length:420 start_codon:yes stop_codon:yes gene_type:complete